MKCSKCGGRILYKSEHENGVCNSCVVKEWSPEKRKAVHTLVALAFKKPKPTESEIDGVVSDALRVLDDEDKNKK